MKPAAGLSLRLAAGLAIALDIALAFTVLGYQAGFGFETGIIFLYVPLAIPIAIAAVVMPAVMVAKKLRSPTAAWILIGLVGAGCGVSAAQVGWHALQKDRAEDRESSAVRALAGLHGEHDGVRFEIRPAAGAGLIDLRVKVADGASAPHLPAARWLYVLCDSKDVQAQFGNDAGRLQMYGGPASHPRETPEGTVFALQARSAHTERYDPDLPDPYCSFVVDDAEAGVPRTIVYAPLHR